MAIKFPLQSAYKLLVFVENIVTCFHVYHDLVPVVVVAAAEPVAAAAAVVGCPRQFDIERCVSLVANVIVNLSGNWPIR